MRAGSGAAAEPVVRSESVSGLGVWRAGQDTRLTAGNVLPAFPGAVEGTFPAPHSYWFTALRLPAP